MIIKLILTGFLLSLFSLVGCSNGQNEKQGQVQSLVDDVVEDTYEIESVQMQNDFLNERNQYLVTTIKELIENLSDKEMLEFAQNQVIYELQVNGESIPKNGQVTISAGEVEVLLSEKVLGHDFLPDEWLEKGKVSGNYIDHLLNIDTSNWLPMGMDGTVNTAQGFQLADGKAGQKFSFNMTEELRDRLKMDTNLIQIEVK
ncbi:hypothetical protein [Bacillus sp. FJAT-29937]|uniref:hypothetical protein n=1 Tax=Bacillus sp. FJAT-29937 TaxID=1720553 RepID=UPI00083644F5|nr:hypothetical protein [Bacillus sp. FJAT-29937]